MKEKGENWTYCETLIVYVCISGLSFKNINIYHNFLHVNILFLYPHTTYKGQQFYTDMTLWPWPSNDLKQAQRFYLVKQRPSASTVCLCHYIIKFLKEWRVLQSLSNFKIFFFFIETKTLKWRQSIQNMTFSAPDLKWQPFKYNCSRCTRWVF